MSLNQNGKLNFQLTLSSLYNGAGMAKNIYISFSDIQLLFLVSRLCPYKNKYGICNCWEKHIIALIFIHLRQIIFNSYIKFPVLLILPPSIFQLLIRGSIHSSVCVGSLMKKQRQWLGGHRPVVTLHISCGCQWNLKIIKWLTSYLAVIQPIYLSGPTTIYLSAAEEVLLCEISYWMSCWRHSNMGFWKMRLWLKKKKKGAGLFYAWQCSLYFLFAAVPKITILLLQIDSLGKKSIAALWYIIIVMWKLFLLQFLPCYRQIH